MDEPQVNPDGVLPPGGEGGYMDMEMPTPEKLLEVLNQLEGMSEEDRDQLREQLLNRQRMMGMGIPEQSAFSSQALMLLTMLTIIAVIFVFFGYKLYKSLKEKERKRDEKRKMKQQKKKK